MRAQYLYPMSALTAVPVLGLGREGQTIFSICNPGSCICPSSMVRLQKRRLIALNNSVDTRDCIKVLVGPFRIRSNIASSEPTDGYILKFILQFTLGHHSPTPACMHNYMKQLFSICNHKKNQTYCPYWSKTISFSRFSGFQLQISNEAHKKSQYFVSHCEWECFNGQCMVCSLCALAFLDDYLPVVADEQPYFLRIASATTCSSIRQRAWTTASQVALALRCHKSSISILRRSLSLG